MSVRIDDGRRGQRMADEAWTLAEDGQRGLIMASSHLLDFAYRTFFGSNKKR